MKIKEFLLALALLGGVFAISRVYSPLAGLALFAVLGFSLLLAHFFELTLNIEKMVKRSEENDRACVSIRHTRKPKQKAGA
jgi:hypothetical protein